MRGFPDGARRRLSRARRKPHAGFRPRRAPRRTERTAGVASAIEAKRSSRLAAACCAAPPVACRALAAGLTKASTAQTTLTIEAAPASDGDTIDFTLSRSTLAVAAGETLSSPLRVSTTAIYADEDDKDLRLRVTAAQNDDQTIDYSSAEATLTVTNIPGYQPPADVDPPPNPELIDTPPIVMDNP